MENSTHPTAPSKAARLTGWILRGLLAALMTVGGIMQLINPEASREQVKQSGWTVEQMKPVTFVLIACFIVYFVPRTAVLGAILLTGYFGGAVATHVRNGDGMWWIAVIVSTIFWVGLYLREPRLRALAPLRSLPPKVG